MSDTRLVTLQTLKPTQIVGTADMRNLVGQLTPILAKSLPMHLKAAVDRVGASLVVEMSRNDYVAKCTARSLLGGLIQVAQLGLELGGPLGQAYLVPYKNEAQFQIGFKGLIALAARSNLIKVFEAQPVFKNDVFSINYGTSPVVMHNPCLDGPRGELRGVYSYAKTIHDEVMVEWMSKEELEAHRDKYSKAKGGTSPWQTAFNEMSRKTVLRRLAKRLPLSAEAATAASLDEMADDDVPQKLAANLTPLVEFGDPSFKTTEVRDAIGVIEEQERQPGDEEIDESGVPR